MAIGKTIDGYFLTSLPKNVFVKFQAISVCAYFDSCFDSFSRIQWAIAVRIFLLVIRISFQMFLFGLKDGWFFVSFNNMTSLGRQKKLCK